MTDTTVTDLVDRYIATWNETDAARRLALVERTWTNAGAYLDPLMQAAGPEAISAMVGGVQARFPEARMTRTSDVDAHHDRVRFSWSLGPDDGAPIVGGLDVGVVTAGKLEAITGFIDSVPG
ncbi:MAG: nuclear transport factor 2 family protein [Phenylobacterium sp.]